MGPLARLAYLECCGQRQMHHDLLVRWHKLQQRSGSCALRGSAHGPASSELAQMWCLSKLEGDMLTRVLL